MRALRFLLLAFFFLVSVAILRADDCTNQDSTHRANCHISSSVSLEVNLGPIPIDAYDGTTTNTAGVLPANCASTSVVQTCIQTMLNNYANQGVTGIRFQFGLGGGANSTALDTSGNVRGTWATNLNNFLYDVKHAGTNGIAKITPTPNLDTFYTGELTGYYTDTVLRPGCFIPPANTTHARLRYLNWLPFGLVLDNSTFWPDCQGDNTGYSNAVPNPYFWGWTPLFNLVDTVLDKAVANSLTVEEFDLVNEIDLLDFTVQARLIYDNKHAADGTPGTTDVLGTVRTKMSNHPFSPSVVTYSTQMTNPADFFGFSSTVDGFDCGSVYGDSALLVNESELTAALAGGIFGVADNLSPSTGLACGGDNNNSGMITLLPTSYTAPTVNDIHAHICITDGTDCYDPVTDSLALNYGSKTARKFYDAFWIFLNNHRLTSNTAMLGEVNHTQTSACDLYTVNMAYSNVNGFNGYSLAVPVPTPVCSGQTSTTSCLYQNALSNTVFRIWENAANGCYVMPNALGPPYSQP